MLNRYIIGKSAIIFHSYVRLPGYQRITSMAFHVPKFDFMWSKFYNMINLSTLGYAVTSLGPHRFHLSMRGCKRPGMDVSSTRHVELYSILLFKSRYRFE